MQATPIEIVQKQRIRIIAVLMYEAERQAEIEEQQKEQQRKLDQRTRVR